MKILFIHSNFIEWKPTEKAVKNAEEAEKKWFRVEEPLVAFIAVEKIDEINQDDAAEKASEQIIEVYNEVKAKRIVIYPYAHLSPELASPTTALKILKKIEEILLEKKFEVYRAQFGWYKEFNLSAKGHPLAELSRTLAKYEEKEETKAIQAEKKLKSYWHILTPEGKLIEIKIENNEVKGFNFSKHKNLEKFARYEMAKSREAKGTPPHVKFMTELELVDYEPGSDLGNFRYYPKGRLIKSLLEEFVTQKMIDYGAIEIESPIMYDYEHPALRGYLERFPARQYTIQTPNKKVFLRFAACFGQFLMAHDATISYKHLPIKLYELTRYSFRVEQSGELAGLRRLRAFTMPDCHALCADLEQAKNELLKRFKLAWEVQSGIGFKIPEDFELALRMTKEFWKNNEDFVLSLIKLWGKPALVELWDERFAYFIFKYEWNFVDNLDKAAALNTDQIDVENSKNFDMTYTDKNGDKKHPIVLHLSPSGAIERVIYALLEKAQFDIAEKRKPQLPLWLAPTQIRLIPLSDKYLDFCEKLYHQISAENIRVDIDDRNMPVNQKIFSAEKEWIPLILVIGEKEKKGIFSARIRGEKEEKEMKLDEIIEYVKEKTKGMPFKKLSLHYLISKRPRFYG
jgi:threonyl-tRNA synthetase